MFMNTLHHAKFWRTAFLKTRRIFQNDAYTAFNRNERKRRATIVYDRVQAKEEKIKKGTSPRLGPEENAQEDKSQQMEVPPARRKDKDEFNQKIKTFYVEKNVYFLVGCLFSLYSIFVYDFFTNRCVQIFSNFFFFIFHFTRKTVNMLACAVHALFIFFQVCVLFLKFGSNLNLPFGK
ncbi:conserved Plasmodium protein, unknown function [Plasmodium knowlesi strain H]|uniref:Uncharacterized protein n=3 Tax=Plasmodium knowlesi TaxID=5850 RepID=A0A5K1ULX9_PLAKH|nr:conserved Plasmodium protein, unknown function [Plasmodium knowlesi strain H]OTN65748.1 Uncharacterized protein PKNOH_S100065400 [Plasmodium knowlesi]CAA9988006.1 conserved Plasmodium protein, unknown function [Plasmodium knowlesi strain H]SBO22045.1 conserved Plasmodium protein, unknown function [Plasmodium knowlesi strain H]SBO29137.1 conserved Plasmodium protein, unknown function [Plasmodium knowlesi strain H]VVS77480.1 conserved Plasmodium protein, unknown function [Plasmodium knowlesi |eukprot:XP_002258985.1 hypothetical protein, conserved in Plasmodium species [Plasmodium knowlesi strain H]